MAGLHGVAKTNVVSYGGTLARTGNSFSNTVGVVHRGKRTITTGHSSHRTSRNYMLIGITSNFNTVVTLGYRASFITGGRSFVGLARGVLSTTMTGGYGALRRMRTLPVNSIAVTRTMASEDNVAKRGVRLSNCVALRNPTVTACGRRNGGFLYAVITLDGRMSPGINRRITVRITTVGPVTISRTNMPTSMLRGRGRVTTSGTHRRNGPRGVVRGVTVNHVNGFCGRIYLLGRRCVRSNGVAITRCLGSMSGSLAIATFGHFALETRWFDDGGCGGNHSRVIL